MSSTLEYTVVDAFAASPFTGNAAAVLVTESPLSEETMQKIASEFNLPMTAFLCAMPDAGSSAFSLRWFNPSHEAPFCGHATLASSHVLLPPTEGEHADAVSFRSLAGQLQAKRLASGAIELDFPAGDARAADDAEIALCEAAVSKALGGKALVVGVHIGPLDGFIELKMAPGIHLGDIKIDHEPFTTLGLFPRGVMLTSVLEDADGNAPMLHSRVFPLAPGEAEDITTGSSHCSIGPLYSPRFGGPGVEIRATQGGKRQGAISVVWDGKPGSEGGRVKLRGPAVTVAKGTLFL